MCPRVCLCVMQIHSTECVHARRVSRYASLDKNAANERSLLEAEFARKPTRRESFAKSNLLHACYFVTNLVLLLKRVSRSALQNRSLRAIKDGNKYTDKMTDGRLLRGSGAASKRSLIEAGA